jgi:hypothetical protein
MFFPLRQRPGFVNASEPLRAFPVNIGSLCLSDCEATRQESRDGRGGATAERLDEAGVRKRQTLRAGCIWSKSFGFRLGR